MSTQNYLLDFATKELSLIGFDKIELGETMLKFLQQSSDLCHNDPQSVKQIISLLDRLVDRLPLSAITEDDFYEETYTEQDKSVLIKRSHRYPHIYQLDGQYYDDRAVAFTTPGSAPGDKLYLYQGGQSSKQPVTLPYYPNEHLVELAENYNVTVC
jgi:hypothetical protein